ncbi:MAG: restriction endonuclease subunit S [Candidatus Doudnabacteria bacterium]|nr:restriction endonuclease subunit S [Candidatus Doudnabacteria bacterium]
MPKLQLKKEYKKYPEYKNSGVEWIGKIPKDWDVTPLRSVAFENEQNNIEGKCNNLLSLSYGKIIQKDIDSNEGLLPESFNTYQVINKGNIVFRLTDLQNDKKSLRVGYMNFDEPGIITSAYLALQLSEKLNSKFTYYLFHAYDIQKVYYGMGGGVRQTLDFSNFKYLPTLIPNINEQEKIANYLDEKIATIDQIIEKKQKLIELLREKRTAVINNAVSKGLDPKAEYVESDVEWIGKIPKGWNIEKIKRVSQMNKKSLSENTDPDFSFKYFDIGSVDGEEASNIENEITFEKAPSRARRVVSVGDSIIATVRTYLKAIAYFDKLDTNTIASTGFAVLTPGKNLLPKYLFYYLQSDRFISQVILNSKGIGYPAITPFDLSSLEMIYPSKDEQNLIIKFLDEKISTFNAILEKTEKSIELLNKFKSSLISNVVTGKVKV